MLSGTSVRSAVQFATVDEEALKERIAELAEDLRGKGRDDLVREIALYEVTLESAVPAESRESQLEPLERVAAAEANPFPNPTIGLKLTGLEIISAAVPGDALSEIAKRIVEQIRGAWPSTHPPA